MQLNRATDISLRILMLAAAQRRVLTIDALADALNVPRNHVAKVVQRLQRQGWLETTRGRGGGITLPEATLDVSVGLIVRHGERQTEVIACEDPPCPLRTACRLRSALRSAQEAFFAALDPLTLRDLLAEPTGPALLTLLPLRPAARAMSKQEV
ncbi:Rrf2 family nitric oxide-sensitive transcriptional repressor [Amycolatopsis bartoniae]|uniref:HTH-type transcriptional repressor NsrR n=1 Tax=Amycolatopsis bartoniae TaxID=941986 RepID=A0A8H9IZB3_9PSEU|nr:Rrf2 family transcriptional regulator [Amycolatopsis bartoniae]MBB2940086.1 Rrf2 family nitric oxide-sensitive transcriptional repressor [Amycolatopsis bartoniae]TVS98893.1 Rrf2 family transcriptional regulator [Amycolatopsis bartoniae]GHF53838.1 HTH-type transcriptional repressor NsrR [Amycolatopsis bartoniae]